MKPQNRTLKHVVVCALVFSTFVCIFSAIGMAIMLVGIYWAFQVFFTVDWWASLLVIFGLLVAYITALSFALELLRGEDA